MKINYIIIYLIIALFNASALCAITVLSNTPLTQSAISRLQKLPEYNTLIKEVESEGPIRIEMVSLPNENFDAFWDSTSRKIRINTLKNQKLEVLICSILFEMHNAKSDRRFKQLIGMARNGQLSKEQYVEKVERMEHENALNCSLLLEKGIKSGIFNQAVRWPIFRDFEDHYKLQQIEEHSLWLANAYDNIAPNGRRSQYMGTLPKLSTQDKKDVLRYLVIKNKLESVSEIDNQKAYVALQKEYQNLEGCYLGSSRQNCSRTAERIKLLQLVFKENSTFKTLIQDSPLYLVKRR
jgi:hypothetical protein